MLGEIQIDLGYLTIEDLVPRPKITDIAANKVLKIQPELNITALVISQAAHPGFKVVVRLDGKLRVHTADPAFT